MKRNQSGFTLVEIAIVLVIIGLLLGGVLKGQELIENAKIKAVTNELQGVQNAISNYSDRYKALPGDDNKIATYGWPGNPGVNGNANGVIGTAAANPWTAGGENGNVWRQLRYAGLTTGDAAVTTRPVSSAGGPIGITFGVFGMTSHAVCVQNVSPKVAAGIDRQLDDGLPQTGSVRADFAAAVPSPVPAAAAPATAAYSESTAGVWTVCLQF